MRTKVSAFWAVRRARLEDRLRYGRQKRFFRCPACRAAQTVPTGLGQSKVVCRRCGEIFLRRT